jgi:prepilin signal peptidase PulO-like enzyme (type II secretory pathway)
LKSEIPFGPFLILAFWTVYIFQVDVLAWAAKYMSFIV